MREQRFRKQNMLTFGLSLAIALIVWFQIGMYAAHLLFGVNLQMFNVFEFCTSFFRQNTFYYSLVLFAVQFFIVYLVIHTLLRVSLQYSRARRFRGRIAALYDAGLSSSVCRACGLDEGQLMVIGHAEPLAFTMRFWKPVIVLSNGLLDMLDRDELQAVVEHESYHRMKYDPLRIFLLQLIAQTIWFIPLTKWAYQNAKILSELQADSYAIRKTGSEWGIGSALLKLVRVHERAKSAGAVPVIIYFASADGAINYRLQQLLEPQKRIPVKLPTVSLLLSFYTLLLFVGMTVLVLEG
ncbi:M56 family metallopeptidase [Paenibacillus tarimensis]|uniref:M56 family metallopeptidase n=1 Tax=Paenibacillus tarimensis TaxID=416012 RepID=UPI001F271E74|nr:M56 family metallopeptidase [Paenibacillus tarimensis]MCF2945780.1 M56 family metallopeptidase [Paenibacillus tarimensis]